MCFNLHNNANANENQSKIMAQWRCIISAVHLVTFIRCTLHTQTFTKYKLVLLLNSEQSTTMLHWVISECSTTWVTTSSVKTMQAMKGWTDNNKRCSLCRNHLEVGCNGGTTPDSGNVETASAQLLRSRPRASLLFSPTYDHNQPLGVPSNKLKSTFAKTHKIWQKIFLKDFQRSRPRASLVFSQTYDHMIFFKNPSYCLNLCTIELSIVCIKNLLTS